MESWIPGPDEYITDAARKDWNPVKWAKHELYPIPLAEIQSNAALNGENNPGFE